MDLSFNCPFLSGWRLLTVVKENWSLVCVFFWRLGVTQCLPMMKPMMYPLSQSLIGFYKRWVFFAWHLWAKVELSKNVGWKPQGGWTCIQLYFFCLFLQIHMFFFHAWLAFHSGVALHPSHLLIFHLIYLTFCCFLLLFPASPFTHGLCCRRLGRAGGKETSSNQCVEWISFEDSF